MEENIYIKRKIYDDFLKWKNNIYKKPIIIIGARQVGKSLIVRKFGEQEYKNFVEINLLRREDIVSLYKTIDTSENKFKALSLLLNVDLKDENTLLFIDEIQESEELISELKYFNEAHKMNIICAGSLLGVKIRRSHFSFPVGQVELHYMYPLDFEEFMLAFNEKLLNDYIEKYKSNYSIRLSSKNFDFTNGIKSFPLYAIFVLARL